jgi:hypothetical protein
VYRGAWIPKPVATCQGAMPIRVYDFVFVTPDLEATDPLRLISVNRPVFLYEVTARSTSKTCFIFSRA